MKITPAIKKQVKDHIKGFPSMKSHYSRSKSKRRHYLSPLLSITEMHRLYVEKHEDSSEMPCVKYHYYAKVFNEEFNLSFGYPKSDTCGTCEIFRSKLASLSEGEPKSEVEKGMRHIYDLLNDFTPTFVWTPQSRKRMAMSAH